MACREKSLWDRAIEEANKDEERDGPASEDSSVVIVGSKNAGKTSLILRFLDRDEAPKPTVALEYTFGRRSKGHNIAKDVGHIWELGGGTWLSKLMDIPLNPDTLLTTTIIIMLDLSKPNELWFTLESLLKAAKVRIDTMVKELKSSQPDIKEKLKQSCWERLGADHPDKSMMEPFLIPFVIVGGKYDQFQGGFPPLFYLVLPHRDDLPKTPSKPPHPVTLY